MQSETAISRELMGKIVDEVFDGAIEDASVIEEIYAVIKREDALSAAEPMAQDENPMRFFADNVDNWGALEWFNRLVDACEDHDRKRTEAFRCADPDEKDMLSLSADTSKMIMSSSAFHLAREHKSEIRSALSAQVQDVAGLEEIAKADQAYVDAVSGKPEKDCWDTENGKEEPGAEKFASDWAWKEYDDAKQKAFDNLRAMLPAAPAKQEG